MTIDQQVYYYALPATSVAAVTIPFLLRYLQAPLWLSVLVLGAPPTLAYQWLAGTDMPPLDPQQHRLILLCALMWLGIGIPAWLWYAPPSARASSRKDDDVGADSSREQGSDQQNSPPGDEGRY